MITVRPDHELILEHRAYQIRGMIDGRVIVASDKGPLTVLGGDHTVVFQQDFRERLFSVNADPSRDDCYAITLGSGVSIVDSRGEVSHKLTGEFADAWFDTDGGLWTAAHEPMPDSMSRAMEFRVARYESDRYDEAVESITLPDPFGDSTIRFPETSMQTPVSVNASAGQDGQTLFWLDRQDGQLNGRQVGGISHCGPATRNAAGDEYLIFVGDDELRRYSLPDNRLLGHMSAPDTPDREQGMGYVAHYLDERHCIALFEGGFLYRIALDSMLPESEVRISGHEPGPVSHFFPPLKDDSLFVDVIDIVHAGEQMISVHHVLPKERSLDRAALAWWPKGALA